VPDKLRTLSGRDVVRILGRFGFEKIGQRGSHIKMRLVTADGRRKTISVPDHREMRRGTLQGIYGDAAEIIPQEHLRPHFFTD
jgi:predicted RNA binding protein YcfA (HicA-like mRNA interferase family)